jgi:hypothetical protein
MVEWTRGITVHTTAERVWPWLVQMGYGRGGWYTPQWVDLFANRWLFGQRTRFPSSANRLLPEYQQVAVGDIVCDGPNYASYFRVQHVVPPHALVYRSIRHPRRGSPIDINDPESPSKIEKQLLTSGTYIDFTWALVLYQLPQDSTRLLVRTRANYSPPAYQGCPGLSREALPLVLAAESERPWHHHLHRATLIVEVITDVNGEPRDANPPTGPNHRDQRPDTKGTARLRSIGGTGIHRLA